MKILNIEMQAGIYDSEATITRHQNGDVTIKAPYIKWVDNNGSLDFSRMRFPATDERAKELSDEIFTEDGSAVWDSLEEFLREACADKWF